MNMKTNRRFHTAAWGGRQAWEVEGMGYLVIRQLGFCFAYEYSVYYSR